MNKGLYGVKHKHQPWCIGFTSFHDRNVPSVAGFNSSISLTTCAVRKASAANAIMLQFYPREMTQGTQRVTQLSENKHEQ